MNLHGLQSNDLPQGPWFLQGPFASKTMIPKNLDPFHWGNMGLYDTNGYGTETMYFLLHSYGDLCDGLHIYFFTLLLSIHTA
jgi:hypothetical protein